jgi:hypothetical protein
MPAQLEISPEDVQRLATLARARIDERLARIPEDTRPQFWTIIANVYGRGLTRDAVSANLLQALPEIADDIDPSIRS